MKVAFAGTPDFARSALERLHAARFDLPLVLTQPDRPSGRGMKLAPSPVKAFAQARGLPVAQPRSLKLDGRWPDDARAARESLERAAPDVMVVAAYGLILPRWVLELPRLGCLNIHASLLPRWRGAAPVQRAIEAGDARTGVTIMQMDEGLDTGDMLLAEAVPIAPDDTAASLTERLAALGARLVVEALELAACGGLARTPQPADGTTYARKIEKAEAPIDWSRPAVEIERRLRAFDPFPGASFEWAGAVIKAWRGETREGSAAPGTVLAADASRGEFVLACGDGAIALTQLQRPGGRRIDARRFLQGDAPPPGARLSR